MGGYRPNNQERGLEEVRQPVVPSPSAPGAGPVDLDKASVPRAKEPLKIYDLSNLYEDPREKRRRPVKSNRIPEIDKRIKQTRADMKQIIITIESYERRKVDPPQELIDELKKRVKDLHSDTMRRIHYMHLYTEKAFKFILQQHIALRFLNRLPTAFTAPLAAEIRTKLIEMQKKKLAWQMERLRRTNSPVWMKPVLVSLANLQGLDVDVSKETAEVMVLREEQWKKRLLQIHPDAVEGEDGTIWLGTKSTRATDNRAI
jgi:hypothetical protein